MRGFLKSLQITLNGHKSLCIETTDDVRSIFDELHDVECDIEIKKHREKRSLDSNSYMWTLCGKLAEKMNDAYITKDAIYKEAIKQVGLCREEILPIATAQTFTIAWQKMGTGWFAEQVDYANDGEVLMRFYYGSSVYNQRQMSRLIEYIKQECKQQGIETMTPEEEAQIMASWKPKAVI